MSSEQIQHLYELVDPDEIRDQMFERICRLEDALNEQLHRAKRDLDSNKEQYIGRLRKEKIDLFGSETTIGSILDTFDDRVEKIKGQLHVVRSILLSLALPTGSEASADSYVDYAFEVIDDLLEENSLRCKSRRAAYKSRRGEKPKQEAHGSAVSQMSQTGSSNARKKQKTAPQDDQSRESPLPPYIQFMVNLAPELGKTAPKMKKDEVRDHIKQRWDADTLGDPSAHLVDVMATLMRPPEAQKGGAKPQALNP